MSADTIEQTGVPLHVGVIMDGNGRWAQKRKLPRTFGHKEGLTVAKKIVRAAAKLGVKYLTLYTFSTENWKRTQEEVGFLMNLIRSHLRAEFEFYKENGIKVRHIGDLSALPEDVQKEIINAAKDTENFTGMTVILAINYGGRDEILRGIKKLSQNNFDFSKLSEKDFELDHKGKVQQKLVALPYLADLLYNPCMIGNFINSGIYIKADYFIGNTKAVLSVGFKTGKYTDYPVTLYREDIRHLSQPTNKVHAIFVKNFKEDFYSKCAYLSKGQEINSLLIAENIRKLIIKDGCSFGTSAAEPRSLS